MPRKKTSALSFDDWAHLRESVKLLEQVFPRLPKRRKITRLTLDFIYEMSKELDRASIEDHVRVKPELINALRTLSGLYGS